VNQLEQNITPAFTEEPYDNAQTPQPPKKKKSIYEILGLLITLSGIFALVAVLFYDPMRDIIAHRPICQ